MTRKPVHSRDERGRHKVDLRQIRSPVLRYGILLVVAAVVVGAALWTGGRRVSDETVAWFTPYVGGAVIAVVALALWLRWRGR